MKKLLYVDALNVFNFFSREGEKWSILGKARREIEKFHKAATGSGWRVTCFIDAGTGVAEHDGVNETLEKWKSRRNSDLVKGSRNVPQASNVLLGDVFRLLGCDVVYSARFDNDDTLAFMAQRDGADVLSADKDFYRYAKRKFAVYFKYAIIRGRLELSKRNHTEERPKDGVKIRELKAIDDRVDCRSIDPVLVTLDANLYRRGCPCPLVRLVGNAHHRARPLRQALYFRLGKDHVREVYPGSWSVEMSKAVWVDEVVAAVENNGLFETRPDTLIAKYYGDEVQPPGVSDANWFNHQFACHAIVWELWLLGQNPRKDPSELLKVMENFEKDHTISLNSNRQRTVGIENSASSAMIKTQPSVDDDLVRLGFEYHAFRNGGKGLFYCSRCGGRNGPMFSSEESCRKHLQQRHASLLVEDQSRIGISNPASSTETLISVQNDVPVEVKASEQLKNVLWELAGRDEALTECWLKVMYSLQLDLDIDKVGIERLSSACHGVLAMRLQSWSEVQQKMKPFLLTIEKQKPTFEHLGQAALHDLLAHDSQEGWTQTSQASTAIETVDVFSSGQMQKASAFVRCDARTLVAHVWGRANDANDTAFFLWSSSDCQYEVRKREIKISIPLVEHRDAVYIRVGRQITEHRWAIVSASVDVNDVELFSIKSSPVRIDFFSGYLIESLPYGVTRLVHIGRWDLKGNAPKSLMERLSGFNVSQNIDGIKSSLKDGSSYAHSLPLFVAGGAAVGAVAGPVAVTSAVAAAGFGASGIIAGSAAAGVMSTSALAAGGGVASGGLVATAQSIGAAGLFGGPFGIAIAGGVVAVGGAAVGIYFGGKAIHEKWVDHKRKPGGPVHHCEICDDRKLSKL